MAINRKQSERVIVQALHGNAMRFKRLVSGKLPHDKY